MKIQLTANNSLGSLNPIALREDGWLPEMWLEVEDRVGNRLCVKLPNGTVLWISNRDIKATKV